jgi:hypothetical protein
MAHDVASTRFVLVLCAVLLLLGSSGASPSHATGIPPDAKLTASDGSGVDGLGVSVSLSGDTALVGAPGDDAPEFNSGSAYVFVRSGMTWSEQAKLTASDGAEGDAFGRVAVSGDTALVGAPNDDDAGPNTGSAYVFVRSGTSWSEQAKLTANDMGAQEGFGISVAVSGDTAVMGAHFDDAPFHDSGSAYVFVRNGTSWSQQAKLTASDVSADAYFGSSVAIEGDTILVGANGDDGVATDAGAAYIFVRSGTSWNEQAKLTASDAAGAHQFGRSVSISGDTAVVGRPWGGAGAAYVFARSGSSWSQQAKLAVGDLAYGVRFGWSVAVSEDRAVVGVLNDPLDEYSGSAYLFERYGASWSEEIELTAPDITAGDLFGVAVAAAGDTALVGSQGDDDVGSDAGAAYVFPLEEKPDVPAASTSGLLVLVLLLAVGSIIGRCRPRVS